MRHHCWPLHALAARLPWSVPTGTRTAPPGSFASSRGGIPTNTCVACPPRSCTRRLERPTPTPPQDAPEIHLIKSCDSKVPRWVRCNHAEGEFHACAQPMRARDWCFCVYLDVDTSGQGFEWPALNSAMDWCEQMLSDGVRPKFQLSTFYNAGGQWLVHRTRMRIC